MSGKMGKTLLAFALLMAAGIFSSAYDVSVVDAGSRSWGGPRLTPQLSPVRSIPIAARQTGAIADTGRVPLQPPKRLVLFSESPVNWTRMFSTLKTNDFARLPGQQITLPESPLPLVFNRHLIQLAGPKPATVFRASPRSPPFPS